MRELLIAVPDATILTNMTPEELGGVLLLLLRQRFLREKFSLYNLDLELSGSIRPADQRSYPRNAEGEITLAIQEAWGWLQAQGLIVSTNDPHGSHWFRLSRRAINFENTSDYARFVAARRLSKESLHESMPDEVWLAYIRGDFDTAVFRAMRAVEVAVRDAASLQASLLGVSLMRRAFDPQNGALTDAAAEVGERDACSALFAGAIGMYKNPQSHRDVNLDDPAEAAEIITLANTLLRIVATRATRLGSP
jgi:uncharacterized protein (TIGR02391 family)